MPTDPLARAPLQKPVEERDQEPLLRLPARQRDEERELRGSAVRERAATSSAGVDDGDASARFGNRRPSGLKSLKSRNPRFELEVGGAKVVDLGILLVDQLPQPLDCS